MTDLDAHALDESKLSDLIRDLDTGHIQDIDRTATSDAISSLWDMVVELRAQVAEAEKRGRQVKPLVWEEIDGAGPIPCLFAKAALGHYYIDHESGANFKAYYTNGPTIYLGRDISAAKAAAQADYEARIRSCLIDAPFDKYTRGRIAGLEEAADLTHRIADGYDAGGDRAIACGLYLTAGQIRALIAQAKGEQE